MSKIQSGACVGTEQGAICGVHEWQEMMSALCCRPLYVNHWARVDSQACVCLYSRHAGQTNDMSLNTQIFLDWWIQQRKCRVIFPQRLHTIGMPSGINTEHIDKKSVPACVETSPYSRLGTEEAGAAVESLPDITSPDPASTCLFVFVCAVRRRWLVGVMTTCSVPQAKMWRAGRPRWPAAPRLPPRDPLPTTSLCRSAGRGLSLHRWRVLPISSENYAHNVKMFQRCIWCPLNKLFPHFHMKFNNAIYIWICYKNTCWMHSCRKYCDWNRLWQLTSGSAFC